MVLLFLHCVTPQQRPHYENIPVKICVNELAVMRNGVAVDVRIRYARQNLLKPFGSTNPLKLENGREREKKVILWRASKWHCREIWVWLWSNFSAYSKFPLSLFSIAIITLICRGTRFPECLGKTLSRMANTMVPKNSPENLLRKGGGEERFFASFFKNVTSPLSSFHVGWQGSYSFLEQGMLKSSKMPSSPV